jgi:hypothetical protein
MIFNISMQNAIMGFILGLVIIYFYGSKKEGLENISDADQELINKIYDFFSSASATDYLAYLAFLDSIKNSNLNIINSDTFNKLQSLGKRNVLTKQDVITELKL